MRFRLTAAVCLLAAAFSAAPGVDPSPSKPKVESGYGPGVELVRRDFKDKLEKADAVVVARFHSETKLVGSKAVDNSHTIRTLHSQFATLSVLKGTVADDFTLRHLRDEYHPSDQGYVIPGVPKRYDFQKGAMLAFKRAGGTAEVLDEPVYFLYLRKLEDKDVKGELYEVVEIHEFAGPGVYEATNPWMSKYTEANRKKK